MAGVSVAFAIVTAGKIADVQTNASGVAQLTGWTLPSFPTTYAIVASAGRLTSAQARLTVTVGPPAKLVAFAMPTSGTVATTLPMSVQVTDLGGNAVPQREIEWSVDSGATVSPTSFFADQAGIAHASLSLGTKSGVVHVRAAVLQTGVVAEFPITARPGMLMQLSPQDTGLSLRVNTPYSVTVRALDYWRNGIPGVALTSRYSGGLAFTTLPTPAISPSTTVTDANGYATFSSLTPPQPGLEYLVIDAPTYSALFRIQGAGDHGYIAPWNGTPIDGLTWTVGAPPPRVGFIVTQANGLPAANVLVTFTLDPGNGTFVGGSAGGVLEPQLFSGLTSTATGLTAVVWNPPPVPGTYVMRVRAPAPNDGGSPLTVTIRVVP